MRGNSKEFRMGWGFSGEGLEKFRRLSLRERIRFVEEIILLKHELGLLEKERSQKHKSWLWRRND